MSLVLPLPIAKEGLDLYDPAKVVDFRPVFYPDVAEKANAWRNRHSLKAASTDRLKVAVLGIDIQNTFCHKRGELFVGGRSGDGAVHDCVRFTEFIYRNLGVISKLFFTLDTHRSGAIFHPSFLVDPNGVHPAPFTLITLNDIRSGKWSVSPLMASTLGYSLPTLQAHLLHYAGELEAAGRYALTVWPYHGMLGGIGHALVAGVEEAAFFHSIARGAQTEFEVKGTNPLTENYSVLGPEVLTTVPRRPGEPNQVIAQRNTRFIEQLLTYDVLIIGGQAKSHCVAWTIDDLLREIAQTDPALARKVYLLEDCTSPVVVPGVIDYTDDANAAFDRFTAAGMHVVKSTDPIETWPGIRL